VRTLKVFPGSRALEIDPVKQQIVWEYTGSDSDAPEWTFYSSFISDARRLPNGNTLINEGMNGRFFQISPAGEIVWEYVSPYFGPQPFGPAGKKVQANTVYRAQPVPYDWTPPDTPHGRARGRPPGPWDVPDSHRALTKTEVSGSGLTADRDGATPSQALELQFHRGSGAPGFTYSGQPSTSASAARASAAWTGLTRAGRLTSGCGQAAV